MACALDEVGDRPANGPEEDEEGGESSTTVDCGERRDAEPEKDKRCNEPEREEGFEPLR
jgi:hypothetical protein